MAAVHPRRRAAPLTVRAVAADMHDIDTDTLLGAATEHAAEPANQACLGESFSALTGPGFGQAIVFFAQGGGPVDTQPGLGDGIQRLQAGLVPDQVVPNTCNNT